MSFGSRFVDLEQCLELRFCNVVDCGLAFGGLIGFLLQRLISRVGDAHCLFQFSRRGAAMAAVAARAVSREFEPTLVSIDSGTARVKAPSDDRFQRLRCMAAAGRERQLTSRD
jgi:hypothetical protein